MSSCSPSIKVVAGAFAVESEIFLLYITQSVCARTGTLPFIHARAGRAGQHMVVFMERGPLYLVVAAATGEPEAALRLQLDLLHAHIVAILTDGFERLLIRNPRFEPRRLLGIPLSAQQHVEVFLFIGCFKTLRGLRCMEQAKCRFWDPVQQCLKVIESVGQLPHQMKPCITTHVVAVKPL